MQYDTALNLITTTFNQPLDETLFVNFASNLLNDISTEHAFTSRHGAYIPQPFQGHVRQYKRPFVYYDPNGERLDVLLVRLNKASSLDRARTMQRNFAAWYLKQEHSESVEAALIAFYHDDVPDWRFSFVRLEYDFGDEGVEEKLTPARRYSFLVGPHEPTHTAEQQLLPFLQRDDRNPTIAEIGAAFQVQVVSKQFFESYKELFLQLLEALEEVVKADAQLQRDFKRAEIDLPNFAKKLLGQIVFLYFVQKKGWMGVSTGGGWGMGPRDFLRRLFDRQDGVVYDNFFNDVLEPLFYRALAVQRTADLFTIGGFTCQIPFLNGGLFEPMGNYDWQNTRLLLPNSLFSNRRNERDEQGSGILDIFDRYNFTVWEEEPLEKEVAVDPEMLGKVFENLLEVQDRKSKGAFYTPREIVHYMCQESLINYLETSVNLVESSLAGEEPKQGTLFGEPQPEQKSFKAMTHLERVPREDIAVLVRQGALALQQDAAKEAGLQKGEHVLPQAVRRFAAELDEALADIKLCDPAIGSGAFPVGMLHEIVQARQALDTQLKKQPTAYDLKRHAIQESIYGVDIDAGAVEIAKLRLWLSLVVDEENYNDIQPLPNLDYKIVRGNSLLGVKKDLLNYQLYAKLEELKRRYFAETHRLEKTRLKAQIDLLIGQLTGDLAVFDFEVYFHEVIAGRGGFDVVIGNPPYIFARDSEKKGITAKDKEYYYENYRLAEYQVNLYPLFIERGHRLVRENGSLCFITPNNWMTINTNRTLRKFVLEQSDIIIVNFLAQVFESAAVDSSIIIYRKSTSNQRVTLCEFTEKLQVIKEADSHYFTSKADHIINIEMFKDEGIGELIHKIDMLSNPLSSIAAVRVGLKAYQRGKGKPPQTNDVKINRIFHSRDKLDNTYFPYLHGRDVSRYSIDWSGEYLMYGDHLAEPRKNFNLFSSLRILVRQIPNQPPYCIHACIIEETALNDLNSMNIINMRDTPQYILGILNSRLVSFWFVHKFGKMQRGTFPQFKVNELAKFPVPKKQNFQTKEQIANLVTQVMAVKKADPTAEISHLDVQIDQLVYQLYGLTPAEIALVEGQNKGS